MSERINSLVVIDVHGSECTLSDFECISAAFTVAAQNDGQVAVLALIDPEVDVDSNIAPVLISKGADRVFWASKESLAEHDLGSYVQVVSEAIEKVEPKVIFFTHNNFL